MTALFRTGRVSDALRAYQEGREVLREELGIDAGPQLRALHKAVLTNDPALLGPGSPPHGSARLGSDARSHDPSGSGARSHDPSLPGPGPSSRETAAASKARPRTTDRTASTGGAPAAPAPRPAPSHLPRT